jgi:polysaccharide pyruvyl transferase WcaK-like protein
LYKWTLLAKYAGVKCIFLNSGAGPLEASLSRFFIKRALSTADYVSLRDAASADLLRKIGFQGNIDTVADSVWAFKLPDNLVRAKSGFGEGRVIGIAPMAYGDSSRHWIDDNSGYQRLIDSLAEFGGRMLECGHRIKIFSSDIWFDSQALEDLEAAILINYPAIAIGRVTRESPADVGELLTELAQVDCYVTCRFHGVVFASLMNVPAIALAPHPKVTTLMGDLDLATYCMSISDCSSDDLVAKFDHLAADIHHVKARIRRRVAHFQRLLVSQFDNLFRVDAKNNVENEQTLSLRSIR